MAGRSSSTGEQRAGIRAIPLAPTASLHGGHSAPSCSHADDGLDALVARALAARMSVYALTFHAPKPTPALLDECDVAAGLSPVDTARLTRDGVRAAREVQIRHADRIAVPIAVETDVTPAQGWPDRMRALLADLRPDHVIGSAHHVGDLPIDETPQGYRACVEAAGGEEATHLAYYRTLSTLVTAVTPLAVGHLDLIRRYASTRWPSPRVRRACADLLDAMAAHGVAVEVNASPLQDGATQPYPHAEILGWAHARGLAITLADDSHDVASVGAGLPAACRVATDAGYRDMLVAAPW